MANNFVDKLNKYEFFKTKTVLREEIKKGNDPDVIYYRANEHHPFTIYIVRKGMHVNGGDFHDCVAHAKRESLAKKKVEDVQKVKNHILSIV
jgi:hypothetical protein